MPWPAAVIDAFESTPPDPVEADFHGSFNLLPYESFPPSNGFVICPQYRVPKTSKKADLVLDLMQHQKKPLLILEIKHPAHLQNISTRQEADDQIRQRLRDFADRCPITTLHGFSAMGARLCSYRLDTGPLARITPLEIRRHDTLVNDTAPAEWWDCDILEPEGEARLRSVLDEIQEASENLAAI